MSGRSVVKQDIPWGGVLAYTRGQTIENDVVEANDWSDYVVGANTKEAREIHAEITGQPAEPDKPASRAATTTSTTKEG